MGSLYFEILQIFRIFNC